MIAVGMVLLWGGYGVASWGYVLVRGWYIPARQWFSPLAPYQWPKSGDPPPIPQGELFPAAATPPLSAAQRRQVKGAVTSPPFGFGLGKKRKRKA